MIITNNAQDHREAIVALLSAEKLPTKDLPATLDNFIVALDDAGVIGVAGLEVYGDYGLLRSLAVDAAFRGQGIALALLKQVESAGRSLGIKAIYLLTETAPDYFLNNGYEKISRNNVPAAVQLSTEFSHVCPQSAIVMTKSI